MVAKPCTGCGELFSRKFNTAFLGELPLTKDLRMQSDQGRPACIANPDGEIAKIYLSIAQSVINQKN